MSIFRPQLTRKCVARLCRAEARSDYIEQRLSLILINKKGKIFSYHSEDANCVRGICEAIAEPNTEIAHISKRGRKYLYYIDFLGSELHFLWILRRTVSIY